MEMSLKEKLRIARIFANSHSENFILRKVLARLVDAARTSGGIAGRDGILCAACEEAESALAIAALAPPNAGSRG